MSARSGNVDWQNIGMLILIGAGAYIAAKIVGVVKTTATAGADAVSRPIAYVISKLILPEALHVPGGVVMADGGYVSFDAIIQAGSKVSGDGTFSWRGTLYKVQQPRREDGNYDAVRA